MTDQAAKGPEQAPEAGRRLRPTLDTTVPHSARVWNHLLGGKDNYPADREVGDRILQMFPGIAHIARVQRRFLARAVRYLAGEAGIRQFLDIGTGLPTADNTHEAAQRIAPDCRIVYVDNDPLVLVHAEALLVGTSEGATDYIEADVRDPERILGRAAKTLDFSRPIGLMMLGIMGQLPDEDDPHAIVRRYLDALPSGSHLALCDGTNTDQSLNEAIRIYNANSAGSYHLRSPEQITRFFDGLEIVAPGVVTTSRWRPEIAVVDAGQVGAGSADAGSADAGPGEVDAYCGIGRKD